MHSQEDSTKQKNSVQVAGAFCLSCTTHSMGPRLTTLETADNPENQLFRRLDSMAQREPLRVKPGTLLLAVYGDNWLATCVTFFPTGLFDPIDLRTLGASA